jgi:hypothetical protein
MVNEKLEDIAKAGKVGSYYVLYSEDAAWAKSHKYESHTRYFDRFKQFTNLEKAVAFTQENLPALLAKSSSPLEPSQQYLVIAQHYGKYHSWCRDESDPVRSYDARTCAREEIDAVLREFQLKGNLEKLYVGTEVKLW